MWSNSDNWHFLTIKNYKPNVLCTVWLPVWTSIREWSEMTSFTSPTVFSNHWTRGSLVFLYTDHLKEHQISFYYSFMNACSCVYELTFAAGKNLTTLSSVCKAEAWRFNFIEIAFHGKTQFTFLRLKRHKHRQQCCYQNFWNAIQN